MARPTFGQEDLKFDRVTQDIPCPPEIDLFKVLDQIAETGVPMEIRRGNVVLKIMREDSVARLSRVKPMDGLIVGNPNTLLDSGQTWAGDDCL